MANADQAHVFPVRVYYEDTDAAGIVYYANYLKFAERARTELMRGLGVEHRGLRDETGISFAVRRCEAEYVRPARLDDQLEVHSRVLDMSGASLWVEQTVRRNDETIAEMKLRLVCVRPDGRPARLPGVLRSLAPGSGARRAFG